MIYQLFGVIDSPFPKFRSLSEGGLTDLISRSIILAMTIGGLFVLFNLVLAGYNFLQGQPDSMAKATTRIYLSILGLIIISASLLFTTIISWFIFGDPFFILNPVIPTPL